MTIIIIPKEALGIKIGYLCGYVDAVLNSLDAKFIEKTVDKDGVVELVLEHDDMLIMNILDARFGTLSEFYEMCVK